MNNFLSGRAVVLAEQLRGPRVYSTDLIPILHDGTDVVESVAVTARALKVKIITKGLVTLNSAFLMSPLAVDLMDANPDLLNGEAILPAFRRNKQSLAELAASTVNPEIANIDTMRLDEHIARLDGAITRVLPFDIGEVDQRFRQLLLQGLGNSHSLIARELSDTGAEPAEIAREIEALDFSNNANLRAYLAQLSPTVQAPLRRFTTACYHIIGTGVVRCETGTDLNPLSEFKAADLVLASRDSEAALLTDEAVFLGAFMGFALDTIQAAAMPAQIIDSISFTTAHAVSVTLREQGFQDKYDEIMRLYLRSAALPDAAEALDALDAGKIASVSADLAGVFRESVLDELGIYRTREQIDSKGQIYRAGADIMRDFVGMVPGLSSVVSFADALKHGVAAHSASTAVIRGRSLQGSLTAAQKRREEQIRAAIAGLQVDGGRRAVLLDAVALLSDIHGINVSRA